MENDPGKWITNPDLKIHEGEQALAHALELLRGDGAKNGFVLFTRDDDGKLAVRSYLPDVGSPKRLAAWGAFIHEYSELMAQRVVNMMQDRLLHLLFGIDDDNSEDEGEDDNDV